MGNKFSDFEHSVLRDFRAQGIESKRLLVAVSGGLDSMVLLSLLLRLKGILKLELCVAHVHHGGKVPYRDQAWQFVKDYCREQDLEFLSNFSSLEEVSDFGLTSESDLRTYRYSEISNLMSQSSSFCMALAHHRDDLLETRVLRLIRGVGPQGLESMEFFKNSKLRPLLKTSRQELETYAQEQRIDYLEDPSNREEMALRNWLRNNWLPQLEEKRAGSLKSMAQSLEALSQNEQDELKNQLDLCVDGDGLYVSELMKLSKLDQRNIIAYFMRHLGLKDYSQNHILEVLKQLDNKAKRHKFNLLKRVWLIDKGRLKVGKKFPGIGEV